jgi:hypothetical protein
MDMKPRVVIEAVLIIALGTLGSILIGLIGFGTTIFYWRNPEFQFLTFGFGLAVLAAVCARKGFFVTILNVLPIAAVCSIPSRKLFWYGFVNAALFFGFAAYVFGNVWGRLSGRVAFGKFLVLGFLLAIFELVKTPLLAYAAGAQDVLYQTGYNALLKGMLGLGLGLGIELAEFFLAGDDQGER